MPRYRYSYDPVIPSKWDQPLNFEPKIFAAKNEKEAVRTVTKFRNKLLENPLIEAIKGEILEMGRLIHGKFVSLEKLSLMKGTK